VSSGGQEKTEDPTPRKLRQLRRRGQVPQSKELTGAVGFLVGVVAIAALVDQTTDAFITGADEVFRLAEDPPADPGALPIVLWDAGMRVALPMLGIMLALLIGGAITSFLQAGAVLATEPLVPKLSKLNPAEGFKKLFGISTQVDLLKSLARMIAIGVAAGMVLWSAREDVLRLSLAGPEAAPKLVWHVIWRTLVASTVILLAASILDYFFQRHRFIKQNRMTKQEYKQDHKEAEGDPTHKQRRSQMRQELIENNMLSNARLASAMVSNPTHLVCALRYDPKKEAAPRLMAKGSGEMAERLREIAKAERIPLRRDKGLARALYGLELNDEIPEDLHGAVSELLRWVQEEALARGELPPPWVEEEG